MADLPRVRDLVIRHGGDKTVAELDGYMEEHARLRFINAELLATLVRVRATPGWPEQWLAEVVNAIRATGTETTDG